jgi:hypothetical protein
LRIRLTRRKLMVTHFLNVVKQFTISAIRAG